MKIGTLVIGGAALVLLFAALRALVLLAAWNWVIAPAFHAPEIDWKVAIAVTVIGWCLTAWNSGSSK